MQSPLRPVVASGLTCLVGLALAACAPGAEASTSTPVSLPTVTKTPAVPMATATRTPTPIIPTLDPTYLTPEPTYPQQPPALRLITGSDGFADGVITGICWPTLGCGDGEVPPFEDFPTLPAHEIRLEIIGEPLPARLRLDLYVPPWDYLTGKPSVDTIHVDVTQPAILWKPNAPPGRYLLDAVAEWEPRGDARYWFALALP